MAEPFFWGAGGQKITSPTQAAKQREIAEALLGASSKPAQNWAEGLSHVAGAWSGTQLQSQAAAAEEEGQRAVAELLAGLGPQSSFEDIAAVYSNPWASQGQSAVAQALLNQNMQRDDPMYQMELERAALELEALKAPPAPAQPEYVWEGDRWWEKPVDGSAPIAASEAPAPDMTSAIQNYEYLVANGVDPAVAQQAAFGGAQTNVNVNTGGQQFANAPFGQDYKRNPDGTVYIDPATGLPEIVRIPGSPAALEAEAAAADDAAQEGAAIASSLEGAEKTLSSTQAVLDLIDNSDTPVTGTGSRPLAVISGTPAGRVRSYVGTLQSGVALGAMQRLKEASSTGATGFGALSAPELQLLINDIGALDPDNTEPDIFRATIARIDGRARRVVADIRKNVSPERIAELGLTEFLEAFDPGGGAQQQQSPFGQSQANPAIFGGAAGGVNDPLGIR